MNELRKKFDDEMLSSRAKALIKNWKTLVKREAKPALHRSDSAGSPGSASGTSDTSNGSPQQDDNHRIAHEPKGPLTRDEVCAGSMKLPSPLRILTQM